MSSDGNFQQRLAPGVEFEDAVVRFLESRGHSVVRNGTEHTHPNFVALLRRNHSDAAKFIRYAPDGVYLASGGSEVIHFDAKASNAIERDAYEVYCAYERVGCNLILFVAPQGWEEMYWQWLSDLRFQDSHAVVARFPEDKRFPIDEDGWFYPRQRHGFQSSAKMSGTPFKYIDFNSMRTWSIE